MKICAGKAFFYMRINEITFTRTMKSFHILKLNLCTASWSTPYGVLFITDPYHRNFAARFELSSLVSKTSLQ